MSLLQGRLGGFMFPKIGKTITQVSHGHRKIIKEGEQWRTIQRAWLRTRALGLTRPRLTPAPRAGQGSQGPGQVMGSPLWMGLVTLTALRGALHQIILGAPDTQPHGTFEAKGNSCYLAMWGHCTHRNARACVNECTHTHAHCHCHFNCTERWVSEHEQVNGPSPPTNWPTVPWGERSESVRSRQVHSISWFVN